MINRKLYCKTCTLNAAYCLWEDDDGSIYETECYINSEPGQYYCSFHLKHNMSYGYDKDEKLLLRSNVFICKEHTNCDCVLCVYCGKLSDVVVYPKKIHIPLIYDIMRMPDVLINIIVNYSYPLHVCDKHKTLEFKKDKIFYDKKILRDLGDILKRKYNI